jgi:hypothetical protein
VFNGGWPRRAFLMAAGANQLSAPPEGESPSGGLKRWEGSVDAAGGNAGERGAGGADQEQGSDGQGQQHGAQAGHGTPPLGR